MASQRSTENLPDGASAAAPLGPRAARGLALTVLALTLLAAALLLTGPRPLLVPYWYALPPFSPALARLVLLAAVVLIYTGVGWALHRGPAWRSLLWALAGGVVIPLALVALLGDPLEVLLMRTISSQATGGFSKGAELTPEMVRNWPALMADWRTTFPHVAISLPGWPLLYAGLVRLFAALPGLAHWAATPLRSLQCHQWGFNTLADAQIASAWLGVLSPLWSALTVLPLYRLARRLLPGQQALVAVLLWPLVPAAGLFVGTLNSPYPLLAVLVVLTLCEGAMSSSPVRRTVLLTIAGALWAATLVLNLALAPLLLFCGLLILVLPWTNANRTVRARLLLAVLDGLRFALGALAVLAAYWLLAGHSPLRVIQIALGVHFGMERAYLPSLGLHLWDFVLFLGLPVGVLAVLGARRAGGMLGGRQALALALGLTLIILLLSGTAQGEVGRVWTFFMPFVALLAAAGLARLRRSAALMFGAAQVLWLLALGGTTAPVDTWLGPRPAYAEVAKPALSAPTVGADARFGDVLQLTGFQSTTDEAGKNLQVALHWKVLQRMATPYYFSAVLVGPDGRVLPGVNWQPFEKRYPTTCWAPGAEIVEQVTLPLGTNYAPGDWWLSLTAFLVDASGAPVLLPLTLPGGVADKQAGIGPLTVR